jgi:hypothetical protein
MKINSSELESDKTMATTICHPVEKIPPQLLDLAKMSILGIDLRHLKKMGPVEPGTLICVFVPADYSLDTIIPNIGSVFVGVFNRPRHQITSETLRVWYGSELQKCQNYGGFVRPSPEFVPYKDLECKIRVGLPVRSEALELAFLQ